MLDWRALAAWLYQGSRLDPQKARAHRIRTIYQDPRGLTSRDIATVEAQGFEAGLYAASSWEPGLDGPGFARLVSLWLEQLVPHGVNTHPLMLDLEGVSLAWIRAFLPVYRELRPLRPTAVTFAPFQDGTVVPVPELREAGLHWYPQLYYGDMSPADPAAVLLEVCRWGFPAWRVHPFYDGARLPAEARDGCVFTLERLP